MASPPTPPLSSTAASPASLSPASPSSPPLSAPPSPSPSTPIKTNSSGSRQGLPDGRDLDTQTPLADQFQVSAETADKMAPRGSQRGGGRALGPQRREADMSGVLSSSQKPELVALINSITKTMQDELCGFFDCTEKPLVNVPPNAAANRNTNPQISAVALKNDSVLTEVQGIQGELKKEAVAAYQKWLALINKRVSEISVVKEQPSKTQPQAQGRFANGKQPTRGPGRGATGRSEAGRQGGPGGGKGGAGDSRANASVPVAQATSQLVPGAPSATLLQLAPEKRQLLFHALLLLVLSLDAYPAYSRVLMARLAVQLRLPQRIMAEEEARVAWGLSQAADSVFTEEGLLKKSEDGKRERRPRPSGPPPSCLAPVLDNAKLGSIAGGPGIGTVAAASILGTMGTLSDGGQATCILFGLCGPRGSAAKTLDIFTKDIQDIGLVPLHGSNKFQVREGNTVAAPDRRLSLTIAISGWARSGEDAAGPWRVLGDKTEAYALSWEQETLEKIGSSLEAVMSSKAWKSAKVEFANQNIFADMKDIAWPINILKISKIVDNPWSVGMVRADKVGMALADAIVNKVQGERGVSLLGFGLGARAIYTCLMSLSERRVFGQVENVIMMGTPAPSSKSVWTALRSVVTGRVINVFSENDHILGFLHRTCCIQFGVAGLQRINGVKGVENVNASKPIDSQLTYPKLVARILKDIGWEDLDMAEVAKAEGKHTKPANNARTPEKTAPGRTNANGSGRGGRGRSSRRKLESLEAQFQAMNIVH